MSVHIIRCTYKQVNFDTLTIGHFAVLASDSTAAVSAVEHQYRGFSVRVEYIATLSR